MVYESVCGTEGSVGEHCSYLGRVPGNEKTNRLKIIESLGRPAYFSHFAMRWRASS